MNRTTPAGRAPSMADTNFVQTEGGPLPSHSGDLQILTSLSGLDVGLPDRGRA